MVHIAAVLLFSGILASAQLAAFVPQDLGARALVATGGWPVYKLACENANLTSCGGTANACCPPTTTCVTNDAAIGSVCCPQGADCGAALQLTPVCADTSWALYNVLSLPKGQGYFCCIAGQIGTTKVSCSFGDGAPTTAQLLAAGSFTPPPAKPSATSVIGLTSATTVPIVTTSSKALAGDSKTIGALALAGVAAAEFVFGIMG